jgi:predicted transcriptional regulator
MQYCIKDTYTIKEAIDQFEKNHERASIVLNNNKKVVGIISQGDIIRSLSNNIDIYAHISTIMLPSFLYLKEKNMEMAYKIFKEKMITLLPIIDKNFEIQDIITIRDIYQYLEDRLK